MADRSLMRPANREDAAYLVANMRPADRKEWVALMGAEPNVGELLRMMGRSGGGRAALVNGDLAGIYGVAGESLLSVVGMPWFLGTHVLGKTGVRAEFARRSRAEFGEIASGYRRLWNLVAVENREAVRWLMWLGFSFPDHNELRISGVEFRQFEMEM